MSLSVTLAGIKPGTPPGLAAGLPDASPAPQPTRWQGRLLQGRHRYEIGPVIGQGGAGTVFRAIRADTGTPVAVKILRDDAVSSHAERARQRGRFAREMRLCAGMRHRHVVAMLDGGQTADGQLFAVLELVAGKTLQEFLATQGPLPAPVTARLMAQVLDGLAYAHDLGIVHRDLKPQNVMVTMVEGEPEARILDFGIASMPERAMGGLGPTLTWLGEAVGSPRYSAPEQLRGDPPTPQADLYAWGLLVVECLTGRPVFEGDSVADILCRQLGPGEVPLPGPLAAHPLGILLRTVLARHPRHRAASAHAVAAKFRAMHFEDLVGELGVRRDSAGASARDAHRVNATRLCRQLTSLCCSVAVERQRGPLPADGHDETLDACQAHWLTHCADIALRHGGQVDAMLGDMMLVSFGYPEAIDRPARRAARAALEMVRQAAQVATPGAQWRDDCRVEVTAAIHVGTIVAEGTNTGEGATPAVASRLLRMAPPGSIMVTDAAYHVLQRYADCRVATIAMAGIAGTPQPVYTLLGERHEHAQFDALDQGVPTPFIGRERERDALLRAWHAAVSDMAVPGRRLANGRRATLVTGEAGIGKSRLVYELCQAVRARGGAVACCACLPEHVNHALFPVLRLVASRWRIPLDGPLVDALAAIDAMIAPLACDHTRMRAQLAAWFGLPAGPGLRHDAPARRQRDVFDVLAQLLASQVSSPAIPVLLAIEDVQWIDGTTAAFLDWLHGHPTGALLSVVLTSRPGALRRWRGRTSRLALRRLSRGDTRRLIGTLIGDAGEEAIDRIAGRAGGNPLFAEEVVRELLDDGALAEPAPCACPPLPRSLLDMLDTMLGRIDEALDTAQLAAMIGLEMDARVLAQASPHDAAKLEDDMERLLEARILYASHELGKVRYAFRHALMREAAYASMTAAARRVNHARVAEAMAALAGD